MDVVVAKILTVLGLLGVMLAGAVFALTLAGANGAPQEAAGSAIALVFAVLPYCAARLWAQWVELSDDDDDGEYVPTGQRDAEGL